MSGVEKREKRRLLRDGWIEVAGSRTVETLRKNSFPVRFVQVHALESQAFTRPWVMRVYIALPGTNPLLDRVGTALREGLDPNACEAAERLGGVDAVVALAQGFKP